MQLVSLLNELQLELTSLETEEPNLERVFRIASFIILGVILLGISYAYQKDWLGLQKSEG